jgi:hypothetical protein
VALVWQDSSRAERFSLQQFLTVNLERFWSMVEVEMEPREMSSMIHVERTTN